MNQHSPRISSQVAAMPILFDLGSLRAGTGKPRCLCAGQGHSRCWSLRPPSRNLNPVERFCTSSQRPLCSPIRYLATWSHHGRLRDAFLTVRGRTQLDPLALRGRLGFRLHPSVGYPAIEPWPDTKTHPIPELSGVRIIALRRQSRERGSFAPQSLRRLTNPIEDEPNFTNRAKNSITHLFTGTKNAPMYPFWRNNILSSC